MPIPGTWDDPKKKITDDAGAITPNVITLVSVSGIGGGSATVTWTTSVASSSRVGYGVYPNLSQTTAETNTSPLVTSHSIILSGLVSGKIYLFRIYSRFGGGKDGGNNVVMDGYQFTQDGQFVAA